MRRVRGFTLIELMIVVAVIAILAGLAISQYSKQVRKSKRAQAKQAIAQIAQAEEKWRMNQTTYGDCTAVSCTSVASGLVYTITLTNLSGTRYTITATPNTDQAKDACGTLTYDNNAGVVTKTPTNITGCWN